MGLGALFGRRKATGGYGDLAARRDMLAGACLDVGVIAGRKLANLTCGDSLIDIAGCGEKAIYMARTMHRCFEQAREVAMKSFVGGSVWLVPYNVNGELYMDIIDGDRVEIMARCGAVITDAEYIAETIELRGRNYARIVRCRFAIWNRTDDLTLINGLVMSPAQFMETYPMTKADTVVLELTADGRVGGIDNLSEMAARLGVIEGGTDADTVSAIEIEMQRVRNADYDAIEALLEIIEGEGNE